MSYNSEPDAQYVVRFAKARQEEFAKQMRADQEQYEIVRQEYKLDLAVPKNMASIAADGKPFTPTPFYSGHAIEALQRNVATVVVPPAFRYEARHLPVREREFADEVMEPWTAGAWRQSQTGDVWYMMGQDMLVYGRGVGNVMLLPRFWSEKEYADLVAKWKELLNAAAASDEEGSTKRLRQEIAAVRREMDEYRQVNFPIRLQHVDARTFFPLLSAERLIPEAVQVYEMSADQARADYGDDALPESLRVYGDRRDGLQRVTVYRYANWYYEATVIAGRDGGGDSTVPMASGAEGDDSKLVRKPFEHRFKANPFQLMEAYMHPQGADGMRWRGMFYGHKDVIKALDIIFSDQVTLHRMGTFTPRLWTFDPALREGAGDPTTQGRPERHIHYEPSGDVAVYKGETIENAPLPAMNPESGRLMAWVSGYANRIILNPVVQGQQLSGQAAVGYAYALQQVQDILTPAAQAMTGTAHSIARLFLRCVEVLSEKFPDSPDKVFVVTHKLGAIGVTPSEVKGWAGLLRVRISHMLNINRNENINLAQAMINAGFPRVAAWEMAANIENGDQLFREREREELRIAIFQQHVIPRTLELAGIIEQKMGSADAARMAETLAQLPPDVAQRLLVASGLAPPALPAGPLPSEAVEGAGPGTVPGSPGAVAQAGSNVIRTGVPRPGINETGIGAIGGLTSG